MVSEMCAPFSMSPTSTTTQQPKFEECLIKMLLLRGRFAEAARLCKASGLEKWAFVLEGRNIWPQLDVYKMAPSSSSIQELGGCALNNG